MIERLFKKYNIGEVISYVELSGGLVNKSYKVCTQDKTYVLKVLDKNSDMDSINSHESIGNYLSNKGINLVSAIKINGNFVNNFEDINFSIYPYVDGIILKEEDLTDNQIKNLTKLIFDMHQIEYDDLDIPKEKVLYKSEVDYDAYISHDNFNDMPYKDKYLANYKGYSKLLKECKNSYNKSYIKMSICHKDIKLENILWVKDTPYLIDLETMGLWNTYREVISVATNISGISSMNFDSNKFNCVLKNYFNSTSLEVDPYDLVMGNLVGRLLWLNVNLDKSLKTKSDTSIKEVDKMIDEINYYLEKRDEMIDIVRKYIN